jgi:hypothetical protein
MSRQLFQRLAGEKCRVGKGNGIQLIFYGTNDLRVAVAQAGNSGAARGIEIGFACLIDDVGTVT